MSGMSMRCSSGSAPSWSAVASSAWGSQPDDPAASDAATNARAMEQALRSSSVTGDGVGQRGGCRKRRKMAVRYSPDHEESACGTAALLSRSTAFFDKEFGLSQAFMLSVLDEADWSKVTPIPYGLPFESGPPYVVCIPATSDHPLSASILAALRGSGTAMKLAPAPGE